MKSHKYSSSSFKLPFKRSSPLLKDSKSFDAKKSNNVNSKLNTLSHLMNFPGCFVCTQNEQRSLKSPNNNIDVFEIKEKPSSGSGPNSPANTLIEDDFNKSLLNIIVKNKLSCVDGEKIDELFRDRKIVINNWSSPFDSIDDLNENPKSIKMENSIQFERSYSALYRNDGFLNKRKQDQHKQINKLDENYARYYFKDLKDLQIKFHLRNEIVKLTETEVPKTSNKIFDSLDRFDIAETYKESEQKLSTDVSDLIEKNQCVVNKLRRQQVKSARSDFLSSKHMVRTTYKI
jgi:hypothetical protein